MNAEVAKALAVESGQTRYTPAIELHDDTIVSLQVLAVSQSGASAIGLTGSPQESTNLTEWRDNTGGTTSVITVAPGLKRKAVAGLKSGYIRVRFDNTGPGRCILRSRVSTTTAPA